MPVPSAAPGSLDAVRDLALSNRTIEAIKMYRNLRGVDLKEARTMLRILRRVGPPRTNFREPFDLRSARVRGSKFPGGISLYQWPMDRCGTVVFAASGNFPADSITCSAR